MLFTASIKLGVPFSASQAEQEHVCYKVFVRIFALPVVASRAKTTTHGNRAEELDGSSGEEFGVVSVPSVEGHLGAALDGHLLVSVDEAGPLVVIEEEHGHLLVDESALRHAQGVVSVVSVAMRPGRLEDARNGDVEFPVPRQRRIAQLLVEVFGNADRVEEAKAVEGAAKLFLGSGFDEILALHFRQHKYFYLERRRMGRIAAEIRLPSVDALALLAKLKGGGKDG